MHADQQGADQFVSLAAHLGGAQPDGRVGRPQSFRQKYCDLTDFRRHAAVPVEGTMTHDSRTSIEARHRRTILIAALALIGVCLFAATAGLSFCVPLSVDDENGSSEELDLLAR
jgi:hypothetical protein